MSPKKRPTSSDSASGGQAPGGGAPAKRSGNEPPKPKKPQYVLLTVIIYGLLVLIYLLYYFNCVESMKEFFNHLRHSRLHPFKEKQSDRFMIVSMCIAWFVTLCTHVIQEIRGTHTKNLGGQGAPKKDPSNKKK